MRIATYQYQGRRHVGQVSADGRTVTAFELDDASRGAQPLIERAATGARMPMATGAVAPLSDVKLEAPLPRPFRNLWCVGRNYHAHAKELRETVFKDSAKAVDQWPIVFTKVPECVIANGETVRLPGAAVSSQIDYEAELALVIGKGGKNISRADALSHVFGWTIVNDVTARDVQMRHQQWDMGKSFDTFCPMGPWIVTADELEPYRNADGRLDLAMTVWRNGEQMGTDTLASAAWSFEQMLVYASRGAWLVPGDVIGSGTCGAGCLGELWGRAGRVDPPPLVAGDEVTMTVEGIGTITNTIVAGVDPVDVGPPKRR